MPGRRSGHHAGSRVLRKAWALPAILLSGALMLISSGPPAAAAPSNQQRGATVHTVPSSDHETTVAGADDILDLSVAVAPATGKLGYAPPTSAGTVVGPLDLYLLEAVPATADRVPADAAWTPTDPQRGPPTARQ